MRCDLVSLFGRPAVPRRRRAVSAVPTEHAEQRMVCQWLRAKRLLYAHVPNEGQRNPVTGSRLRGIGMQRGVPDLLVFTRPNPTIAGVAIEMKRRTATASGVTPEQREWIEALKAEGWACLVAYGCDDAIAFLEGLYGR